MNYNCIIVFYIGSSLNWLNSLTDFYNPYRVAPSANGNSATVSGEAEYGNGGVTEYEAEPLPALGTARALYPFDGKAYLFLILQLL